MKKLFSLPIFLVLLVILICGGRNYSLLVYARDYEKTISICYNDEKFVFNESDWVQNRKYSDKFTPQEMLVKLYNMGFSPHQCMDYVYGKLNDCVESILQAINKEPLNATIDVRSGRPEILNEQIGERVDEERLYRELFYKMITHEVNIKVNLVVVKLQPVTTVDDVKLLAYEKSNFVTYINGENQEGRINNIKRALDQINGTVIMPNDTLSFNSIIGETTKENGYFLAKVILNGKYADDYGGGVCQAATTLYNAALIAGLEVKKVRPHSLKVGYVAGSFDAMVSAGISDLVIKNCYSTPIFIHAYATDYECGVKIFGQENEFQIKRRAEIIEFSEEEFPDLSYKSEGYLDYYKDGELIKSEHIRKDSYKKVKVEKNPL